ncbi:MAG: 6-bladed beta-propeller [Rhodothermales bacterium]
MNRRSFVQQAAALAGTAFVAPNIIVKNPLDGEIIGHGDFKYRVQKTWGDLDPGSTPVKNCHEMVMDSKKRLIMITDETKNNILIYDKSGKLLDSWGSEYPGGHGLTLWDAGGEEFLFLTDPGLGLVAKTTLDGRVLLKIEHPKAIGQYGEEDPFRPTETAIGPNGDIYVADGYGSQYILQYTKDGEFIRKFGGKGDGADQFSTAHGVCVDTRDPANPSLICTSRAHNAFKRFSLDGQYQSTLFLPGAFVCRAVIAGDHLYSGVCWSRLKYLNQTDRSGFVTILDKNDRVVSNPGGTPPVYREGELQLMVQDLPIFFHCHDVCIDDDENIYVCQWNAEKTYPIKLERV